MGHQLVQSAVDSDAVVVDALLSLLLWRRKRSRFAPPSPLSATLPHVSGGVSSSGRGPDSGDESLGDVSDVFMA